MPRLGFYELYEFLCKNGFKWVQMGYYWVIGFNPLGFGLGWVIEGGTQNPTHWVLGRTLRPKMGSAEV